MSKYNKQLSIVDSSQLSMPQKIDTGGVEVPLPVDIMNSGGRIKWYHFRNESTGAESFQAVSPLLAYWDSYDNETVQLDSNGDMYMLYSEHNSGTVVPTIHLDPHPRVNPQKLIFPSIVSKQYAMSGDATLVEILDDLPDDVKARYCHHAIIVPCQTSKSPGKPVLIL